MRATRTDNNQQQLRTDNNQQNYKQFRTTTNDNGIRRQIKRVRSSGWKEFSDD
jgi:hypothetical protein